MRMRKDDWVRMGLMTLLCAPPFAFMVFDFVFPSMSWPSLEKNLMVGFLLSILFGMPAGYLNRRTDVAILSAILTVLLGYVIAVVAYGSPFLVYDFRVIFADLYFLFFLRMTVILVLLLILGAMVGTILGQIIGDAVGREETSQHFARPGR